MSFSCVFSEQCHTDLYKELEVINFNMSKELSGTEKSKASRQYDLFKRSTKYLLLCGQCLGLNPVRGITAKDSSKLRFKYLSINFMYSVLICTVQAIAMFLCIFRLFKHAVNISTLAFVCFYGSCFASTCLFILIGQKWPILAKKITNSLLDEYVDERVIFKCNLATGLILFLSILEHVLSFISKIAYVMDCLEVKDNVYKLYIEYNFSWFFEAGIPDSIPMSLILQVLNIISTINWNYSDLFIMCMSFYLTSILNKINDKIIQSKEKRLPPPFWRLLREDYTRATGLVYAFDDAISHLVFTSFATNLFFICLQLFNILANGVRGSAVGQGCVNYPSGPFGGYEGTAYFTFSTLFILGRFVVVSLVAARVHSASRIPALALYDIPSSVYCDEVQRFIEQVHGNVVALSGLQFFYVTKQLVLSIAGTIVTYELVLLQFNGENMIQKT